MAREVQLQHRQYHLVLAEVEELPARRIYAARAEAAAAQRQGVPVVPVEAATGATGRSSQERGARGRNNEETEEQEQGGADQEEGTNGQDQDVQMEEKEEASSDSSLYLPPCDDDMDLEEEPFFEDEVEEEVDGMDVDGEGWHHATGAEDKEEDENEGEECQDSSAQDKEQQGEEEKGGEEEKEQEDNTDVEEAISCLWERYEAYVDDAIANRAPLTVEEMAGVQLLDHLNKAGAPLVLYEKLMKWHHAYRDTLNVVTSKQLYQKLRTRYNMEDTAPYNVDVHLPGADIQVKVPCHNAGAMLTDLLTDPRIKEEDYLFYNDTPGAPPPEEWLEMVDINTGKAYRDTYQELIAPEPTTKSGRTKVLVPVELYMDGTVTGSQQALSIELVKFTLGIFNREARGKDHMWRNLGIVPRYEQKKAQARTEIAESSHFEASCYLTDGEEEEDDDSENGTPGAKAGRVAPKRHTKKRTKGKKSEEVPPGHPLCRGPYAPPISSCARRYDKPDAPGSAAFFLSEEKGFEGGKKMQDLHAMLHAILFSYRKLQNSGGVEWNMKWHGKVERLQLIPFVIYLKGDTVEHEKHCGKYGSRTGKVACLCRYCTIATDDTDDPNAPRELKTKEMITKLIQEQKYEELKGMSQHVLWNAHYELRFGLHNDHGIHQACPIEILHWIYLGMYKYDLKMFIEQTGESSQLFKGFLVVTEQMGLLFRRQSDKSFPRSMFKGGIKAGHHTGIEHQGIILVMAAALRSTDGRNTILGKRLGAKQRQKFFSAKAVEDWLLLLETHLQLGEFLKMKSMPVNVVERFHKKAKEVMKLTKRVGNREKGMGLKTAKIES